MMRVTSRCLQESPSCRQNTLIMLANLGSPETLSKRGIRVFLREFLSDRRVINMTRWLWFPILYGVILPLRPAKLLEKYKQVWMYTSHREADRIKQAENELTKEFTMESGNNSDGKMEWMNDKRVKSEGVSTLTYETHRLAEKLQTRLSEWDAPISVVAAMRYGSTNSIHSVLTRYYHQDVHTPTVQHEKRYDRLIVLPLFPQYSSSTSASVFDAVVQFFARAHQRHVPHLHFIRDYATNTTYIQSITHTILVSLCKHYNEERLQALSNKKANELFYDVNSANSLAELGKRLTRKNFTKINDVASEETTKSEKKDVEEKDEEDNGDENVAIICSYHSLPVEYVQCGDDYDVQCHRTTECVIEELGRQLHCDVRPCVLHVYQSKFGKSEWLSPFLTEAMECLPLPCDTEEESNSEINVALTSTKGKEEEEKKANVKAAKRIKREIAQKAEANKKKDKKTLFAKKANNMYFARKCVTTCFVVAPGFATDCLETIEEIGQDAKERFIQHGGKHFCYIPALNHSNAHVETLLSIIKEETVLQSTQSVHLPQTLRDNVFTYEDVIVEVSSKPGYVVVDGESIRINNKYNKMVNKGDTIGINDSTTESKAQVKQQDDKII